MNARLPTAFSLCILGLAIFTPNPAAGFGRDGHRIVARIAEKQMKATTRTRLLSLLGNVSTISDSDIASWADMIEGDRPETKPWHYVDIPVNDNPEVINVFNAQRDCHHGDCVIARINNYRSVMEHSMSLTERREAAKFLIHFVGDVHQPLHCAERHHDAGGNTQHVIILNHNKKLHQVWDTVLVDEAQGTHELIQFADLLSTEITPAEKTEWTSGGIDPVAWANEGHKIACQLAYHGIPEMQTPTVSDEYVTNGKKAIRLQLKKAGVRLAAVLDEALD